MKIWVDDVRPAPPGYTWARSVYEVIWLLSRHNKPDRNHRMIQAEVLDLDHDAGDYASQGGDYIKILDWMEEHDINDIAIHLHTMNPVGRENMRRIIQHNGWKEV